MTTLGFGCIFGLLGGCFSLAVSESESETCGRLRDFDSSIGVSSESRSGGGSALGALSVGAVEALAEASAVSAGVRGLSEAGGAVSGCVSCSIPEVGLSGGVAASGRGGKGKREGQSCDMWPVASHRRQIICGHLRRECPSSLHSRQIGCWLLWIIRHHSSAILREYGMDGFLKIIFTRRFPFSRPARS